MANELKVFQGASLDWGTGRLKHLIPTTTQSITQTTEHLKADVISVTTSETDLDTTGVGTNGWLYMVNLGPTNFVKYGPKSLGAMVEFGRLKVGEAALFRLAAGVTLRWVADTATCKVQYALFDD